MESCTCINCTGDTYHIEQMQAEEAISKDDYMENKPQSVHEKLYELRYSLGDEPNSSYDRKVLSDVLDAINTIDNELIALALELPTEQAEKMLAIQERLY